MAGSQWKESSSTDYVVCLCKSLEFPEDELLANLSRVLKPGGTIFLQFISESAQGETVIYLSVSLFIWSTTYI